MPTTENGTAVTILVCDGCGRSRRIGSTNVFAWDLLWLQADQAGWTGSGRPLGPHYCTFCAGNE